MDAINRLLAESDIKRVLVNYCRGVDRMDRELIDSVYHEDAIDDHSRRFSGPGRLFSEYLLNSLPSQGFISCQHQLHNCAIDFSADGDVAHVETFFTAAQSTGEQIYWMIGRYLDRFERRNEIWKIVHRRVVHDMNYLTKIEQAFPPENFLIGTQSKDDPAYTLI